MYHDRSDKYKRSHKALNPIDPNLYKESTGYKTIEELKVLAEPLENKKWLSINSTFEGGGVAEMLYSVVPLARGLGLDARWYCMEGDDDFFTITKKLHNLIQGVDQQLSIKDLLYTYIENTKSNFHDHEIMGDLVVVHDPQPIASIMHGNYKGNIVWRCHIDTTDANQAIWNFLVPYINHYHGAIFTSEKFVKEGIRTPVYNITPCIDPLTQKNTQYSKQEAVEIVTPLANEHDIDLDRPIVLAVSRYDIHKNQPSIVKAFQKMKKDPDVKKIKPLLVLVGNLASDDPEGQGQFENIKELIGGDPDVRALLNIPDNDRNIGALMRLANHFVHVSTKEGFGLVVTEAMWQGAPVIGSRVGGIVKQVIDGKTGYLVEPMDVDAIAMNMKKILLDGDMRNQLSETAVTHVQQNFLLPVLVRNYIILMRYLLKIDKNPPFFQCSSGQ